MDIGQDCFSQPRSRGEGWASTFAAEGGDSAGTLLAAGEEAAATLLFIRTGTAATSLSEELRTDRTDRRRRRLSRVECGTSGQAMEAGAAGSGELQSEAASTGDVARGEEWVGRDGCARSLWTSEPRGG
jgi:hypothetical protein